MFFDCFNLSFNIVCLSPSFNIIDVVKVVKFSFNKISEVFDFCFNIVCNNPLLDLGINMICCNESVNLISKSLKLNSNSLFVSLVNMDCWEDNWGCNIRSHKVFKISSVNLSSKLSNCVSLFLADWSWASSNKSCDDECTCSHNI